MNKNQNPTPDMKGLKKELLDELAAAVGREDDSGIFRATERLRQFNALLMTAHSLVKGGKSEATDETSKPNSAQQANGSFSNESVKERRDRGERVRSEWVEKASLLGIVLTLVRGALYRTHGGDIVGIACAREKPNRNAVWWLGLPHGKFQRAVLLCESGKGKIFAVCLPQSFFEANGSKLSKTRAGQTHFTVVQRGSKFLLAGIDVTSHIDNYSLIA